MADSIATSAKTESAQPDFSHGLLDLCPFGLAVCVILIVVQRARTARPVPTTTTCRKPLRAREENGVSEGNQGYPFFMRLFEFGDQMNR
jgi:hypothetical protein